MQPSISSKRDVTRSVAIAMVVTAIVAAPWIIISDSQPGDFTALHDNYLYILGYSYAILLLSPIVASNRVTPRLISILGAAVLVLLLSSDLTTVRYFDAPLIELYPYLPVNAGNVSLNAMLGYAASYVPATVWFLSASGIFLGLGAAHFTRNAGHGRVAIILLAAATYLATAFLRPLTDRPDDRIATLMEEPSKPPTRLARSDRQGSFSTTPDARFAPRTIVVVIMESTSASTPSSEGAELLSESIARTSRTGEWINFSRAVTVSNATDVSVPSILTGSGAHEPVEKLHALPIMSQFASARDYQTAFVTSSTLNWGGFDTFLSSAKMDKIVTAEDSGLPFINDLAVDDQFAYQVAAQTIQQADGKLFLTLYPQSLHKPFQNSSAFEIPHGLHDRRARAAFIAEAGFRLLFDTLRKTDRLDDALIILVGDHGEFNDNSQLRIRQRRLHTFDGGILSPIMLVKAPVGLSTGDREALRRNSLKLVSNADIAPTIADLLGGKLENGLTYDGYSLFADIPEDRTVFSTSTNEWRDWTQSALAVSRGNERLMCDPINLCRLGTEQDGGTLPTRKAETEDELFKLASRSPVMRRALGSIYRGYYR